jgi:ABC-type nitrate/sulfonate/bicarbonate transport system substrate-binding protein
MTLFFARLMTIGGFVAFVAAGAAAQQKNLRPLRVNVFRVDAAMAAAKARGLFAAEGLDVTITTTPNSTEQMRGISNGNFDIASTAFDNVLAWSGREGAEIVAITQTIDKVMLPVYVRPGDSRVERSARQEACGGRRGYGLCLGAAAHLARP